MLAKLQTGKSRINTVTNTVSNQVMHHNRMVLMVRGQHHGWQLEPCKDQAAAATQATCRAAALIMLQCGIAKLLCMPAATECHLGCHPRVQSSLPASNNLHAGNNMRAVQLAGSGWFAAAIAALLCHVNSTDVATLGPSEQCLLPATDAGHRHAIKDAPSTPQQLWGALHFAQPRHNAAHALELP